MATVTLGIQVLLLMGLSAGVAACGHSLGSALLNRGLSPSRWFEPDEKPIADQLWLEWWRDLGVYAVITFGCVAIGSGAWLYATQRHRGFWAGYARFAACVGVMLVFPLIAEQLVIGLDSTEPWRWHASWREHAEQVDSVFGTACMLAAVLAGVPVGRLFLKAGGDFSTGLRRRRWRRRRARRSGA